MKDIKTRAMEFAINAHMGQVRKSEKDKPMIVHPLTAGKILEEYGYDDNIVAAAYLHDVVEDTKYTLEDIKEEFGDEVANLVNYASEPDKSLSWEERKKHTINEIKYAPLKNKLVVCADKISNLEDLYILFQKQGKRNFTAFKRGEESQRWYYTSIYESLIYNEDASLPIFKRLKEIIDKVFNQKEDEFLENKIFEDNKKYYQKLKSLHAKKQELQILKSLIIKNMPYVIEFTGTPRTGKTSIINNLSDLFKKGGFNVLIINEYTTSLEYKKEFKEKLKDLSTKDRNIIIVENVLRQLNDTIEKNPDIILIDRSLNDRQIWNYRLLKRGDMSSEEYIMLRDKYLEISSKLINYLVITYTDSLTCLKRDYYSNLSLEPRNFLNINNVEEFNECLNYIKELICNSVDTYSFIDTTNATLMDSTIKVTDDIMDNIRKEYLHTLKKQFKYTK